MTLQQRISYLIDLFNRLEMTSSRLEKEYLVENAHKFDGQLSEDLTYALEILDGRHKLGYTYATTIETPLGDTNKSLKEYLRPLFVPKTINDFSFVATQVACDSCCHNVAFVSLLVNRGYRLGIGKSQLTKEATSPMLAKAYNPDKLPSSTMGYYVTEKLDGNRCIASYDWEAQQWKFFSRNGKAMRVSFDMGQLNKAFIYDGEVLSHVQFFGDKNQKNQQAFNKTSGLINAKYGNKKDLIYVIFDSIDEALSYNCRRTMLQSSQELTGKNVFILPVLKHYENAARLKVDIALVLSEVMDQGGEGVMINVGSRRYEQKRTDALLKYKETQTADMRVVELTEGTGKYEGCVGALECLCKDEKGNTYTCFVGSGLSQAQRQRWAMYPEEIVGKIVEVAYFSISQDEKTRGTKHYSLRFPRLKKVRTDKSTTSIH